jgi:hypothetical protein
LISECPMHTNFSANPNFRVVRCSHLGSRYVIETAHADGSPLGLDYVEEFPDGGILLEPYTGSCRDLDAAWDRFVARMRQDIPPDLSARWAWCTTRRNDAGGAP